MTFMIESLCKVYRENEHLRNLDYPQIASNHEITI